MTDNPFNASRDGEEQLEWRPNGSGYAGFAVVKAGDEYTPTGRLRAFYKQQRAVIYLWTYDGKWNGRLATDPLFEYGKSTEFESLEEAMTAMTAVYLLTK